MMQIRPRSLARRFVPSPAMVVAMVALLVALSGSAYAVTTINGKNIKKSSITGKQVKNSSLTGADIKNSSLTGADVKNSSLTGTDVKDGSIAASDIASGVIPGTPPPPATNVVTNDVAQAIPASFTYSDVSGMSTTYTAPSGTNKLLITYSAECSITSTFASQYLTVQILVDGTEALPAEGANAQFCTQASQPSNAGANSPTNASMQRVANVGPGAHTVKVQATVVLAGSGSLDGQTLSVQPGS